MGGARCYYLGETRVVQGTSSLRFSFLYHSFYCHSTTCQIGISMITRNLIWGILTSGLDSILFYRHIVRDANEEPHHILSCSEVVHVDATSPSLFSLCAAMLLLDAASAPRPMSMRNTLQPYSIPSTAGPSRATRSNMPQGRGGRAHGRRIDSSLALTPYRSTSTGVFPPAMAPASRRLRPMSCSSTLRGVRKVASLEHRVGVRGQCLLKVLRDLLFDFLTVDLPISAILFYILLLL
jgi:hypothetical protein